MCFVDMQLSWLQNHLSHAQRLAHVHLSRSIMHSVATPATTSYNYKSVHTAARLSLLDPQGITAYLKDEMAAYAWKRVWNEPSWTRCSRSCLS